MYGLQSHTPARFCDPRADCPFLCRDFESRYRPSDVAAGGHGQIGEDIQRRSRMVMAPKRPDGGFDLVVHPLGKGGPQKAYVVAPDGTQRELTASERLYAERMKPRARRSLRSAG